MAEYLKATLSDRDDVIDFANYVFSQSGRPHNFKTLLPKVYGDDADWAALASSHYIAKEGGKVRALVACPNIAMNIAGKTLKIGLVGTVSVHLYSRGEGHMKALMNMMLEDQRAKGTELLMLGGQRQRYGYFGFDHAGTAVNYDVDSSNLRHVFPNLDTSELSFVHLTDNDDPLLDQAFALYETGLVHGARPRENFLLILRSWSAEAYAILRNGSFAGYLCAGSSKTPGDITLVDETMLPLVLKAWFKETGISHASICVKPYETARVNALAEYAGGVSIGSVEMINPLCWARVLDVCFSLKATYQPLRDGRVTLAIGDETFCLRVQNGVPSVESLASGEQPIVSLSHLDAIRLLFSPVSLVRPAPEAFENWLPLPLGFAGQDAF